MTLHGTFVRHSSFVLETRDSSAIFSAGGWLDRRGLLSVSPHATRL